MPTFLVTGATGRQGGSTARQLLSKGAKVHALVRDPDSEAAQAIQAQGAVLFEGDSGNATAISKALEGVTGVFFNPPYPGPETVGICETFIKTCAEWKGTGLTTFVQSSAAGVEKHAERLRQDPNYTMSQYFSMRAQLEQLAKDAGFEHLVILRPSFLIHEYLPPDSKIFFPGLDSEQKLFTALKPDTKVPHLMAEDVGTFAAAALMDPERFKGLEINLAAENLTLPEVAKTMSEVSGVQVEAPVANFDENGKAMSIDGIVAGYHQWTNEVDASIDVEALNREFGFELTELRQFFEERSDELKKALGV